MKSLQEAAILAAILLSFIFRLGQELDKSNSCKTFGRNRVINNSARVSTSAILS